MRITVLCENTTSDEQFEYEHGLSLYIEHGARKVLFDMGQSDAFTRNAEKCGADVAAVDTAILSHGHYDHGGGIAAFFEHNHTAPLYLQASAFEPHYNGTEKYIGLDTTLRSHPRLHFVDTATDLGDGMMLFTLNNTALPYPIDAHGLTEHCGDRFIPEPFTHEQYLLIEDDGQRVLVSGCSHKGVLNILELTHPDVFIGGFHFMKLDPDGSGKDALAHAAIALASYPCRYYTCHCTGEVPFAFLKSRLGEQLTYIRTGDILQISFDK